jgi:hypothetical protein
MPQSMKQIEEGLRLLAASKERSDADYAEWLQCDDALKWLAVTSGGLLPVAVWMGHIYVYSVLVPQAALTDDPWQDIGDWSLSAPSGWGYSVAISASHGDEAQVDSPIQHTGSRALDQAEPLVFLRYFEGRPGKRGYTEPNQHVAHILDTHWMEDRSSYSRLNERGNFDDVIQLKNDEEGTVVAVSLEALEPYMLLKDSVLIRLFNIPRAESWAHVSWEGRDEQLVRKPRAGIHAKLVTASDSRGPVASKLRGFQMIERKQSDETLLRILKGESPQPKQYASFTAMDFRNGRIHSCSCDPDRLGNYFVESDLPFETSPAFFNPEVLARYKQDPDKYQIEGRVVSCRGGWHIQYDINAEGQVHAFLVDLGRLPHAEQLYWKAFNEQPRGGISHRSYKTDFLGEWDEEYDPLASLRQHLTELPPTGTGVVLWKPDEHLLSRMTHVVTESKKEWEDAILNLAKLVVDGLESKAIGRLADSLGCRDKRLGTVKQLARCLLTAGIEEDVVSRIADPLTEMWTIRSRGGVAHRGSSSISQTREHFRDLLTRCDSAFVQLVDIISSGKLDARAAAS